MVRGMQVQDGVSMDVVKEGGQLVAKPNLKTLIGKG